MSASQNGGFFFNKRKKRYIMTKELITGAELIVRSLEHLNVSTVFGVPGGAIFQLMILYMTVQ